MAEELIGRTIEASYEEHTLTSRSIEVTPELIARVRKNRTVDRTDDVTSEDILDFIRNDGTIMDLPGIEVGDDPNCLSCINTAVEFIE